MRKNDERTLLNVIVAEADGGEVGCKSFVSRAIGMPGKEIIEHRPFSILCDNLHSKSLLGNEVIVI